MRKQIYKMQRFQDFLKSWPREKRKTGNIDDNKVMAALARAESETLEPEGFLALLSPAAAPLLEDMAQIANGLTLRHFGRSVNIFTPLYISDFCSNQCRYCGFNARNPQKRRHLSVDEAAMEAFAIADKGFRHILILTGDARNLASPQYIADVVKRIRPKFASIGIEIYSLHQDEYLALIDSGVDSMTMFQETYTPDLYEWLHPVGPKHDYSFRLGAPERAAAAGMRSIGIGALLGLDEFEQDAFATGLHAWWLMRNFPEVEISVSVPRICPHEGEFEVRHGVSDRQFAQYITALRCFLPSAGITCSSRESANMRNHIIPLGVTRVSAGVSTAVGGRATEDLHNPGQFEISDTRSLEKMIDDLAAQGYQAVLKDWENPLDS